MEEDKRPVTRHAKPLLDIREALEQELHITKQEAEHQAFVLFKDPLRKNQVAAIPDSFR
ncbi:hypothetical protein ARMGADRAFT_1019830 [Armillaria gallica]|uniref:Uncharacterized protein n=1 Tax=Armillaria gallica TaxID=47427 RepID=A0A2H3D3K7_ARMGA|nr:hypothetical protein ARMGADRAFT_1019830 [Armillaria gallica]